MQSRSHEVEAALQIRTSISFCCFARWFCCIDRSLSRYRGPSNRSIPTEFCNRFASLISSCPPPPLVATRNFTKSTQNVLFVQLETICTCSYQQQTLSDPRFRLCSLVGGTAERCLARCLMPTFKGSECYTAFARAMYSRLTCHLQCMHPSVLANSLFFSRAPFVRHPPFHPSSCSAPLAVARSYVRSTTLGGGGLASVPCTTLPGHLKGHSPPQKSRLVGAALVRRNTCHMRASRAQKH